MSNPSWIYVLVEDQRHRQFVYRYLARAGYDSRQMTIELAPSGKGSAEQWVRENFARQVGKCRSRNSRARTVMLLLLDVDVERLPVRLGALNEALIQSGQAQIDELSDPIARLLPKRNIETWILCLNSGAVDEVKDYKHSRTKDQWNALMPSAAERFYEIQKNQGMYPGSLIESLVHGIREVRRAFSMGEQI